MFKTYLKERALEVAYGIEDLLLDKKVWIALLGVIVAVAKWQGWNIPSDVFLTIELLIVAVIIALKGNSRPEFA